MQRISDCPRGRAARRHGHGLRRSAREGVGRLIADDALEQLTGESMHRKNLIACVGLGVGLTAVVSAQAPSPRGTAAQMTIYSIRVNVIGCVVAGRAADQYRLTKPF